MGALKHCFENVRSLRLVGPWLGSDVVLPSQASSGKAGSKKRDCARCWDSCSQNKSAETCLNQPFEHAMCTAQAMYMVRSHAQSHLHAYERDSALLSAHCDSSLVMHLFKTTEPFRHCLHQLSSSMSFTKLCRLGLTHTMVTLIADRRDLRNRECSAS